MNILIFNLGMDKNDAPLAFTIDWVNEFANHCDQVIVLSMRSGDYAVAQNVQVFDIGHQKGYSKPRLLFNFYYYLIYILWKYKIDGVFSHMNQLFSALGGFVLKVRGVSLITWYAHPSVTISLKIAHFFSTKMVASVFEAYPYNKDKLVVIGQGIDTDIFENKTENKENIILYTGRISRSKDIDTLIKAFKINETYLSGYKIHLIGNVIEMDGSDYISELKYLIKSLNLEDKVIFKAAVLRNLLPNVYSHSKLFINLTPAGFGDKVAWEAMACETPTLVANPGMKETLGEYENLCLFEYKNENDLAIKMLQILQMSDKERNQMGLYLRNQVIKLHSLEALPHKVLSLF